MIDCWFYWYVLIYSPLFDIYEIQYQRSIYIFRRYRQEKLARMMGLDEDGYDIMPGNNREMQNAGLYQ